MRGLSSQSLAVVDIYKALDALSRAGAPTQQVERIRQAVGVLVSAIRPEAETPALPAQTEGRDDY